MHVVTMTSVRVYLTTHIFARASVYPRAGVSDVAQRGDSWRPRLRNSNSANRCIAGIWLTAVDSKYKAAVCSLSLCVTVTAARTLKGNLLSGDLTAPCLHRATCSRPRLIKDTQSGGILSTGTSA